MLRSDLIIEIAGGSGEGAISAGDILAMTFARSGLNVSTSRVYPAEIRGTGNTMFRLRTSSDKLYSAGEKADLFFALNAVSLEVNSEHLVDGTIIFYESTQEAETILSNFEKKVLPIVIPFTSILKEIKATKCKNIFVLGIIAALLESNIDIYKQLKKDIEARYSSKNQDILEANIIALDAGIKYAKENISSDVFPKVSIKPSSKSKLVMTGNEAIAFGSLVAGCRFYAGYPITPATDIMEWIAKEMPKLGGTVLQAEDEIAAIVMALGASYAGVRSMTATSGPGLSLMSEAIGLSAMAELPVVIVDVQRGGPSTGLPTKPEQSDLSQAVYGTHGDSPKIVIAPTNVEDCFYQIINAFNLAEKYQVPVILLSDASLGQRRESVNAIDLKKIEKMDRDIYHQIDKNVPYLRYGITPSGVSPMSHPGIKGGAYVATGLEHNELSAPNYTPEVHEAMTEKRFRKIHYAKYDFHEPQKYGTSGAKIGIITWGSSAMPIIESVKMANRDGYEVELMYPTVLHPMPSKWVNDFVKDKEILIFPERNFSGQLANIVIPKIAKENPVTIMKINKYSGEDFTSTEIYEKIKDLYEEE